MIDNKNGTYCFLNVTFWECVKFYLSNKLTNNMIIKESNDAEKKSSRSEDMD